VITVAPHVFVVRVGAKLLGGIEMTLLKFKSGFLEGWFGRIGRGTGAALGAVNILQQISWQAAER
jgi:hypothetical protein